MAIRNNAPREDFDNSVGSALADPWDTKGKPKMLVKIEGLRQLASGENLFELEGVEARQVDWFAVGISMGFGPDGLPEELADKMSKVLWDHDILEVLRSRIKPA